MPLMLDEEPQFANAAEERVWTLLCEQLGPTDVLGADIRVSHDGHDREVDLLVGLDGGGLVVVEVKGGGVTLDQGTWQQWQGDGLVGIDPVGQARNGKYALQAYLAGDTRWGRRKVRWSHAVVLVHTAVDVRFATPDCPRNAIFGRDDLDGLASGLRRLSEEVTHAPAPDVEDLLLVREILAGRFPPQADLMAFAEERNSWSTSSPGSRGSSFRRLVCCVGWRSVAAQGAARPGWRWSRPGACRSRASGWPWSATPTGLRPT